ncbi:MAG TPA: ankyrin repeat domain-containing protein [Stellaceae bacterium]|jgi:ankyrin repeat protein|nr:ankyrin repeat domain-containing protein [Stellaceae bacterium]
MVGRVFDRVDGAALMRRVLLAAATVLLLCPRSFAQGADFSGYNDIAIVASHGKTDDLIRILQSGRTPNAPDEKGETALHYAAQLGNQQMVQALLYYKAAVDPRDQFGNTPLHWAAQRGSVAILQMLIDAKAAIDPQNRQGVTPLMMAAQGGQAQAVRLLLKDGADPHRADFTGRDVIGWAEGKPAIVQMLRSAK